MELSKIKVKKRSGQLEGFDTGKLKASMMKAGCVLDEAEKIASNIEKWSGKGR